MNDENNTEERVDLKTFYYTDEQAAQVSVSLSISPPALIFKGTPDAQETLAYWGAF